jgi:anti-anti-sigma factor
VNADAPRDPVASTDRCTAEFVDGVLVVQGEVDAETAPHLVRALCELSVGPGPRRIDLSGVRFIDSRGIEALFALAADDLEIIVGAGSLVERVLHTVGLDLVAKVRPRTAP